MRGTGTLWYGDFPMSHQVSVEVLPRPDVLSKPVDAPLGVRLVRAAALGACFVLAAGCATTRSPEPGLRALWQPGQGQGQGQQGATQGQGAAKEQDQKGKEGDAKAAAEGDSIPVRSLPQDEGRAVRRLTRRSTSNAESREPRFRFEVGFGYGRQSVGAGSLGRRDEQDAAVMHWGLEFWANRNIGVGLRSEAADTVGDLFEGQTVSDGQTQRSADADLSVRDFAAYFAWNPTSSDRVRVPFQIGPTFMSARLDYDRANIEYDWAGAGVRVGVRPEFTVVDGANTDLVLYTGASYGVGFASVHEDRVGPNENYDTEFQNLRGEAGVRLEFKRFILGLSYVFSDTGFNLSDIERGRRVPDFDSDTHMYMLTFGGKF